MGYHHFAEHGLTELVLALLFAILVLVDCGHPSVVAYVAVGFALLALAALLNLLIIRRRKGKRYEQGEREAMPRILRDISSLTHGSTVKICGTGVTAIVYMANEVYHALKRGVNFHVYLLHPQDFLIERLAGMEPDFEKRVFEPITRVLKTSETLRGRVGAEWTDDTLKRLQSGGELCSIHDQVDGECILHSRIICTSAEIWKRIAKLIVRNDPEAHPGELRICFYRSIPFIKAWRFHRSDGKTWYYVADYLYYPGVGIDNPIHRVEKRKQKLEKSHRDIFGFINTDRIDAHFHLLDAECNTKASLVLTEPQSGSAGEDDTQHAVNRKPDKTRPRRIVAAIKNKKGRNAEKVRCGWVSTNARRLG